MMRFLCISIVAILLVVPSAIMLAQQSGSHSVTVRFQQQNEINIGEPKSQDASFSESKHTDVKSSRNILHNLNWIINPSLKKISVSTDVYSEAVKLRVQAVDCNGCAATGNIALTSSGQDLVTDMDKQMGGCGLEYTIEEKSLTKGSMGDYTVFYTITDAL